MTIEMKREVVLPVWAFTALTNNDWSGIEGDDQDRVTDWEEKLVAEFGGPFTMKQVNINENYSFLGISLFGKADSCYDIEIWAEASEEEEEVRVEAECQVEAFELQILEAALETIKTAIKHGIGWVCETHVDETIIAKLHREIPEWQMCFLRQGLSEAELVRYDLAEPSQVQYDFEELQQEMARQLELFKAWGKWYDTSTDGADIGDICKSRFEDAVQALDDINEALEDVNEYLSS